VFICGHHRSGTTLLQNLLDGHPQLLSIPSEGTYFTSFRYVARRASTARDMDRFAAEWITRCVDPNFAPHFRLGMSDERRAPAVEFARRLFGWHEALRGRVPGELAPLLALVAAYKLTAAPNSEPSAWVEKTPRNERYVARFGYFAGARFIQLVRDPRAVLASLGELYRTAGLGSFDAVASARSIGESLRLANENRRRLGSRYLAVRYEDLVDRSHDEIERVRQLVGIAPHSTLYATTAGGHSVAPNSAFSLDAAGRPATRAAAVLSDEHLALLGVYAGSAARTFGYELPVPPPLRRYALKARHLPGLLVRAGRAALARARGH
jgi:hypothetical protein